MSYSRITEEPTETMEYISPIVDYTETLALPNGATNMTRITIPAGTPCKVHSRNDRGLSTGIEVECTIGGIRYTHIRIYDGDYKIVEGPLKNNEIRPAESAPKSAPKLVKKAGGRRKHRATKKARRHRRRYSRRNRS